MDSNGLISRLTAATMPFRAIFRYELRSLLARRRVWAWFAAATFLTLLVVLINWRQLPGALLIGAVMVPYLVFPWFLVVMVLGVEPVAGARVEELADGILSRPVRRSEFLLASWAARLALVLGSYLAVAVPTVLLVTFAKRPGFEDSLTFYGVTASLGVVGLVLCFQVSLAFLMGTLLRRPVGAIAVLLFLWYPVDGVLGTFSLEEFSPISLSKAIPTLVRQPWREDKDSARTAPPLDLDRLSRDMSFTDIFTAAPARPERKHEYFQRNREDDFTLWKVLLGYALPTLACVGLATWSFCRRDL